MIVGSRTALTSGVLHGPFFFSFFFELGRGPLSLSCVSTNLSRRRDLGCLSARFNNSTHGTRKATGRPLSDNLAGWTRRLSD